MNGTTYIILGVVLIVLSLLGLAAAQFFIRGWKRRYDAEWEHNE